VTRELRLLLFVYLAFLTMFSKRFRSYCECLLSSVFSLFTNVCGHGSYCRVPSLPTFLQKLHNRYYPSSSSGRKACVSEYLNPQSPLLPTFPCPSLL